MSVVPTNGPGQWRRVLIDEGGVKRLRWRLTGQVKLMCPRGHRRFEDRGEAHQPKGPKRLRGRRRRGF